MSLLDDRIRATNPDFIYYDITLENFQSNNTKSPHLTFRETRTNPFVPRADDYYLSIVRFQMDTYSLPSYQAKIQPNQPDPNKMIQSITIEYDDGAGNLTESDQIYLTWVSDNVFEPTPPPPSATGNGLQYTNTEYYYGNSFQSYLNIINTGIAAGMADLDTKLSGGVIDTVPPPFLKWNHGLATATIYAPGDFDTNKTGAKLNLYFNRPLYGEFTSIRAVRYDITGVNGKFYKIIFDPLNGANKETIDSVEYIKNEQEFSTISNWTPVQSIVFTTQNIPVVSNHLSAPIIFNDNSLVSSGNNSNFANVITDMSTNEMVYKPNLIYVPSAEFRRIDLRTNQHINTVDISCYWKDKQGVLHPFTLMSGASASIKFCFEKKGSVKSYLLDKVGDEI